MIEGSLDKESECGFRSKMRTTWASMAFRPSQCVYPAVAATLYLCSPSDVSHFCSLLFTAENKTPSRVPSTEQDADNDDVLGKHSELNNAQN